MIKDTINEALNFRYATKSFKEVELEADKLEQILHSANMAPTSYGLQPFRLIRVTDKDLRAKLQASAYNQSQFTMASELIVVARVTNFDEKYIDDFITRIATTRGITEEPLEGYRAMMKGSILSRPKEAIDAWIDKQAYIALGFMLETAALLKVDACPMEGIVASEFDEKLGLASMNLSSICTIALGYRSDDAYAQFKKVRLPIEDLVITK